jgi:D-alanyl-D-alanine carboxypeptidase
VEKWLAAALEYVPRWIEHQMRLTEQPGCSLAVAHRGDVVLEAAFGHADLARKEKLTPRHRFRVASHSKTFTAAAVMKLREQRRLRLDDRLGDHVGELHRDVANVTIAQLLSHSAGIVRDGPDAGQWQDRRPFLDADELRADLAGGTTLAPNTRFKYSNHGYGLLGLAIEAVAGEPYVDFVSREIVAASGLGHTAPDAPLPRGTPFARGHSSKLPLGRRIVVPAQNATRALASATGFVATASDLARFFGSLSPAARFSVLTVPSRLEMTRRQWKDPYGTVERWYGLGTISGALGEWDWFGHTGSFQGTVSRTVCVPAQDLTLSVLTNSADGLAHAWVDGALHIVQAYARHGAPSRRTAAWSGRWWNVWGAIDLLPMSDRVLVANPALPNPLQDATQLTPQGRDRQGSDRGEITLAGGFASFGEGARIERDVRGRPLQAWLGGTRLLSEARAARELARRYR